MIKNAYFAAGCFWGVEHKFQNLDGVLEAISGYSGGKTVQPTNWFVKETQVMLRLLRLSMMTLKFLWIYVNFFRDSQSLSD